MNSQASSAANQSSIISDVIESNYDWVTFEGWMYQFWKPETVTAERKRIHQTWFDYRHMHPALRSCVFVHEYNRAYKRAYKRFYGTPKRTHTDLPLNAHKTLYKRSPRSISMTLSRMHLIDELGCPYDSFFDAAFNHFMQERAFDEWKKNSPYLEHMPLPPLQLLADASSLISSQKMFEQNNVFKLRLPKHSHYSASKWVGTSNQKACAKWLISQVRNRPDRNIALARLCYDMDLLREKEVVRELSIDTVKKMRDIKTTLLSQ